MPNYRVLINDNAHYMDESQRADHGVFGDADGAIAACKEIVDDELNTMWKPGTTAKELYKLYVAFGPDPFVVPHSPNDPDVEFLGLDVRQKTMQRSCPLGRLGHASAQLVLKLVSALEKRHEAASQAAMNNLSLKSV
jgi:hypothetical protein